MRYLLAVDGSESSHRAVDYVIAQAGRYKDGLQVFLINVQPSLADAWRALVDQEEAGRQHHDAGMRALAVARSRFKAAGIAVHLHIGGGDPAQLIADYAKEKSCNQIVMGTRGLGTVAGLLFGSVTTKVLHLSDLPVVLIK